MTASLVRCFKLSLFAAIAASPAGAHSRLGDDCRFCNLPVLKDTSVQDNEVSMVIVGKTVRYRCVMCAIADAKVNHPKADVRILAPSTIKGQPIEMRRTGGSWSIEPASTVFIWVQGSHGECQTRYRAARTKAQFDQFVQANAKMLKGAKPLTLAEVLKKVS